MLVSKNAARGLMTAKDIPITKNFLHPIFKLILLFFYYGDGLFSGNADALLLDCHHCL